MVATTIAPSSMKRKQIQTLFLTGLILSFIGWVWETIFSFILHSPNDRGFLVLPFCTIYGFALIFIYLLFGTPSDMHLFGRSIFPNHAFPRYLAYFFSSLDLSHCCGTTAKITSSSSPLFIRLCDCPFLQ